MLAQVFALSVGGFAVMNNHLLFFSSSGWSDEEVVWRGDGSFQTLRQIQTAAADLRRSKRLGAWECGSCGTWVVVPSVDPILKCRSHRPRGHRPHSSCYSLAAGAASWSVGDGNEYGNAANAHSAHAPARSEPALMERVSVPIIRS